MVAVSLPCVRLEIVARLGKEEIGLGLASGPAHAGLGIGDERGAIDEAGLTQRKERKLHRGRVAAGIGNESGLANALAIGLRESVDRLAEELRCGVRNLVPLLPDRLVLETEVRRKVDEPRSRAQQRARPPPRDARWRCGEEAIATP